MSHARYLNFQKILTNPESIWRFQLRRILKNIAKDLHTAPASLFLHDEITDRSGEEVAGGHFSKIYTARYRGQLIAVKVPRDITRSYVFILLRSLTQLISRIRRKSYGRLSFGFI